MLAGGALLQGRYKILEPLSEGGMSIVYLAEDSVLCNRVAVKEMKEHFLSPQERALAAEQFRKEAQILANLEHPGLPRVSNFFQHDQRHYLVMDYIQGDTMEALINQHGGRLPEEMVLRVAIAVARVLDYLHHVTPAVIFRDLKPSNIMVARAPGFADSEQGRVKLIDFGISKIFDATQGTRTIIKGAGTPGYAPPEQYGSQGRMRTDARSDIYSLGATMYSMLTGQIPAEATDRWMNGVALSPPRTFNDAISLPLEELILQMMELKPEDRPSSARGVLERLNTFLAVRSATAEVPRNSSSGARPARRFRSSVAGGTSDEASAAEEPPTPGIYPFAGAGGGGDSSAALAREWFAPAGSLSPMKDETSPNGSAASAVAGQPPAAPSSGAASAPSAPVAPAEAAASIPSSSAPTTGPPPWGDPRVEEGAPAAGAPPTGSEGSPWGRSPVAGVSPWPAEGSSLPSTHVRAAAVGEVPNPTVRGRPTPRRSPVVAILGLVGLLALLAGGLVASGVIPMGGTPSPAPSPVARATSPSVTPSPVSTATPPAPSPTVVVLPTRIGVNCTPSGAKMFVDGAASGESTGSVVWINVVPGRHTVKVKKDGYLTHSASVEVAARQQVALTIDLVKEATMRITSRPAGAQVAFDGKPVGKAPIVLKGLVKGTHSYKVWAAGRVSETGKIALQPGQDAHVDITLKEIPRPVYHPPPPPAYQPPAYQPPAYRPPYRPPVYYPQPRATSVEVPAPRATAR